MAAPRRPLAEEVDRPECASSKVRAALDDASSSSRATASAAGRKVAKHAPAAVKDAGGFVIDGVLEPTVKAAIALIDLAADWVVELNDPEKVLDFHRLRGHDVQELSDLSTLDLAHLDLLGKGSALRWGTFGAAEGAAMGALAFVPVAGTLVSIPADALVIHMLSTAIATRAAYSYGFDADDEQQRGHVDRMVRNHYVDQAAKVGVVHKAAQAFDAGKNRVKWSEKLRNDHRILEAIERLMKAGAGGRAVPVEKVVSKLPAIGVVTSAGLNARTLGSVAKNARAYGQTLYLAEKYSLELPSALQED